METMIKKFNKPEIEVIEFNNEDIILTSNLGEKDMDEVEEG